MKKSEHLPMFGVGPLYVYSILVLTILGIVLSCLGYLNSGKFDIMFIPLLIIGIILIIFGVFMWLMAIFNSKIDKNIVENKLVTTGVYSWVRNPIYSAISIALTGLALCFNNLWLIILPFIFWGYMTVLLKHTEEKWLQKAYGEEYLIYCKQVNRCIPWIPKKEK